MRCQAIFPHIFCYPNSVTWIVFYRYLPSVGIPESITADVILSIIEEYLERKSYYNIDRGVVNLTALGLSECQKSFRDWD